ncbi:MAG: N-acetyl-1-D-myo-inositol-2-amino-2-deoxy-alpha-D-glucopyranoside deacetylase [Actinomycetales bacterium]
MGGSEAARRLLFVHAHPDDETLWTGPTMARYAAEGAHVTLVTCTLGEEGEVIPPGLRHLASDRDDALGPYRRGELEAAMAALGVSDHRLLADGRWRDSGMAWVEPGVAGAVPGPAHPDAFVSAPTAAAAAELAAVMRDIRPQVVVTYDPYGGYGHPDHIKTHEITTAAVKLVASDTRNSDAFPMTMYWVRQPRSWADAELAAVMDDSVRPASMLPPPADAPYPSVVVDDDVVTTVVDGSAYLDRVRAALRAHATQVRVEGDWVALSNGEGFPLSGCDAFQRVGAPRGLTWTGDLFSVTDGHGR